MMKLSASIMPLAAALVAFQAPSTSAFKPFSFCRVTATTRTATSYLHMLDSSNNIASYETVVEFNRQFKQGLKYVLVPQEKVLKHPVVSAPPPESYTVAASLPDMVVETSPLDKPSSNPSLDAMAKDVDKALQAAKEVVSSNFESKPIYPVIDRTYPAVDPVVDKTIAQLKDAMEHPPNLQDFIPKAVGAPPGEGLATPLLDYVTKTLNSVQDAPPLFDGYEPSRDFETVAYGFQVKSSAMDAFRVVGKVETAMHDGIVQFYADNAPVREQIRTTLLANNEHLREQSARAAETVISSTVSAAHHISESSVLIMANSATAAHQIGEQSVAFSEKMGANAASVAHQISDNAEIVSDNVSANAAALAHQLSDNAVVLNAEVSASTAALAHQMSHSTAALRASIEHIKDIDLPVLTVSPMYLPADQFAALQYSLQQVLRTPGWTLTDVLNALKSEELGGWYAGAIVGCLLLAVLSDRQSAVKLATAEIAMNAEKKREQDAAEKHRLEGMVVELTQAVAILTAELRDLKTQRAETNYALASMQSDVRNVKNEVGKNSAMEKQLSAKLDESNAKNEVLRSQLDVARFEVATLREVNVSRILAHFILRLVFPEDSMLTLHTAAVAYTVGRFDSWNICHRWNQGYSEAAPARYSATGENDGTARQGLLCQCREQYGPK